MQKCRNFARKLKDNLTLTDNEWIWALNAAKNYMSDGFLPLIMTMQNLLIDTMFDVDIFKTTNSLNW